jgi:hypothetical protein
MNHMTIINVISLTGWVGTVLILFGYYLNANKKTTSWITWFFGNTLMLIYSMFIEAYPQVALALVLLGLNVYGYIQWKLDQNSTSESAE